MSSSSEARPGPLRVAVAGNPNTGKTTLFNRLTGSRAKVGNYPGVTVERHIGKTEVPGHGAVELMDVPGTYSLSARSEEEKLAITAVAGLHPLEQPDAVVLVVDATQLSRNLYLALQLLELGVPVVVALNMTDMLGRSGQHVDTKVLARELGVPVVPIVASKGVGLDELRAALGRVLSKPKLGRPGPRWVPEEALLATDVARVSAVVPPQWSRGDDDRCRALALWALLSLDDEDEIDAVPAELRDKVRSRRQLAEASGRHLDQEIIEGRYGWIDARSPAFLREDAATRSVTDRLDRVLLHPTLGFAIFLVLMTVVFQALFAWSDPLIGGIESIVGWVGSHAEAALPAGLLNDFVVKGLIEGVGAVLVFLPQILMLFFFIGLMEDTGYMSRVAYLMDRIMRLLGLHGRAFVPMLSGYACAVPAVLATRTMERRRDRLLTMMVVPLMTCSARLPVYALLIAALVPVGESQPFTQGLLLAGMYLFSTVVALGAAAVLGRTVIRGPRVPLLLEMPPYRVPHWGSVARMMFEKGSVFLKEAGTVILACTIAMWVLLAFPRNTGQEEAFDARREAARVELAADADALAGALGAIDAEESGLRLRNSWGGRLGHTIEPTLEPLGFDWKIGVGLIGAFAAREVFVSTMAVVYGLDEGSDETSSVLRERIRGETRQDGSPVFTPVVCFSLMVFFALACQCMSTLAAVYRETGGWRWPGFLFLYMTVLAWLASFLVYQGGRLLGFD
jgi:ferrous iron transport protein B